MELTIELPEYFVRALKIEGPEDAARRFQKAIASEAYRTGILSREGLGEWLNLTSDEIDAFLRIRRLGP